MSVAPRDSQENGSAPLPSILIYRPDIQGLRAISIMLVVLAHAGVSAFSGGFVGVDVFFVISGYLITGLLVQEYARKGSIHLTGFFAKRLKRLLPALLVMLSLVLLASSRLLSLHEASEQIASAVYSATWTSNLFFAFSTVDYFAELRARDLFLHTWSLGVEEQFYLAWSVLLLITLALLTRRQQRDYHSQLLMVLGVLFAGSLGLLWYWTARQPLWSFYLMPSRIWQFALGAWVYVWFHGRTFGIEGTPVRELSPAWGAGSGIIGLALIIGSAMLLHPGLNYPGFWALLPSLGAALTIAAGHQRTVRSSNRVLAHPVLVFIGDRSYSWYLWHWPVLMLGFAWGMQNRPLEAAGLVALSFLLAILSYRWVELPFWKGRLSHPVPSRSIFLSLAAMLAVILGAQHYLRSITSIYIPHTMSIADLARSDMPEIYALGCDARDKEDIRPCLMGDSGAPKTVVLLGDSIGAQWYSLLPGIFPAPEWRTVILTKSSCPMVDEDVFFSRTGKLYTSCTKWRNAALNYLSSLKPDVVLVGSASTYTLSKTQWTDGSTHVLARLTAAADHVIVVPGTPSLSFDGPGCLTRHVSAGPESVLPSPFCREALTITAAADVAHYLAQVVARFPNASLLDLNDLVCPSGYCAAQNPSGLVVFRDSQHLTDSFVRKQIPKVLQRLELLGMVPTAADSKSDK